MSEKARDLMREDEEEQYDEYVKMGEVDSVCPQCRRAKEE